MKIYSVIPVSSVVNSSPIAARSQPVEKWGTISSGAAPIFVKSYSSHRRENQTAYCPDKDSGMPPVPLAVGCRHLPRSHAILTFA